MSYSSYTVAAVFTQLADKEGLAFTQIQLQKLVYIAHGFKLASSGGNSGLINEHVIAWRVGVVLPTLYEKLKYYNLDKVPVFESTATLSIIDKSIVAAVYRGYKALSGVQLSMITCRIGTPWYMTWYLNKGEEGIGFIIPDHVINQYYINLMNKTGSSIND